MNRRTNNRIDSTGGSSDSTGGGDDLTGGRSGLGRQASFSTLHKTKSNLIDQGSSFSRFASVAKIFGHAFLSFLVLNGADDCRDDNDTPHSSSSPRREGAGDDSAANNFDQEVQNGQRISTGSEHFEQDKMKYVTMKTCQRLVTKTYLLQINPNEPGGCSFFIRTSHCGANKPKTIVRNHRDQ